MKTRKGLRIAGMLQYLPKCQKSDTFETICCPLCGVVPAKLWLRQDQWTVVRCAFCDLRITWPRADGVTLARMYDTNYYEDSGQGASAKEHWPGRAEGILADIGITLNSVLDFGAGEGHFVHALRALGFAAEGIEPSSSARAAAKRLYGLELRPRLSAEFNGRFQLVTLVHSLEHVSDPVATLRELAPMLKPGGLLFVEVPNADSIELWWPHSRRKILDLPLHLYHFVPETLSRIVERAGFHVVQVQLSNPALLEWALGVRARLRLCRCGAESDSVAPRSSTVRNSERSLWKSQGLPWIRSSFPGYKFHLVAVRL